MNRLAALVVLAFVASARSQSDICPSAAAILPCVCNEVENRPELACSQINDEKELERIFSANFPVPNVQTFTLQSSFLTGITRNVFGNVSFEDVFISTEYINEISETAFENSKDTLQFLDINESPITETSFPFATLGEYTELVDARFTRNLIGMFPQINSDSLRILFIRYNPLLTTIPERALGGLPEIIDVDLSSNGIVDVHANAFVETEQLQYLSLSNNNLRQIGPTIFRNLTELVDLDLSFNQITYIEHDTFRDLESLLEVNLNYNNIEQLNVSSFYMCPNLETVRARNNRIYFIQPGTFVTNVGLNLVDLSNNNMSELVTGTFNGLNHTALYLDDNKIDYIRTYAFGIIQDSVVSLQYNSLTDIFEYWLGNLLERNNEVNLLGNPITCGCEIAWLFDDPSYQELVLAECQDGQLISELDPDYYLNNC